MNRRLSPRQSRRNHRVTTRNDVLQTHAFEPESQGVDKVELGAHRAGAAGCDSHHRDDVLLGQWGLL